MIEAVPVTWVPPSPDLAPKQRRLALSIGEAAPVLNFPSRPTNLRAQTKKNGTAIAFEESSLNVKQSFPLIAQESSFPARLRA